MEQKLINNAQLLEYMPKESICVISKHRVVNIAISDIIRVSRMGNKTMIRTRDEMHITWESLKNIMQDLPVNEFAQVHQSHVVRLSHINKVNSIEIHIDGLIIPLIAVKRKELQGVLARILDRNYEIAFKIKQLS